MIQILILTSIYTLNYLSVTSGAGQQPNLVLRHAIMLFLPIIGGNLIHFLSETKLFLQKYYTYNLQNS